jgi:formate dehydrogenase major subunit
MTETAELAHYVLPVAMWAESEGSVTSLDRLVKWRFKAVDPPGEARQTLYVLADLGERLGLRTSRDPREVFEEMKEVVPLYSKLSLADVMDHSKNSRYPNGELVLYSEKFLTKDGFARFVPVEYREIDRRGKGLVLITGRVVTHYNTDSLSRYMGDIEEAIYLNPEDMRELGIREGQEVLVRSQCGEARVKARKMEGLKRGFAFMPNSLDSVNYVVCDVLDPETRIPLYKSTAVTVTPQSN